MLFTDFMKLADQFEEKANMIINVFEEQGLLSNGSYTHYFNGFDNLNLAEGTVTINTIYYTTGCSDTDHVKIPVSFLDGEFDEAKLEEVGTYAEEQVRLKKEAAEQRRVEEANKKILAEREEHFKLLDQLVKNLVISADQAQVAKDKWDEDHEM